MTPTIGRIVHYKLSQDDVDHIDECFPQLDGAGRYSRNPVREGEVYPAQVVATESLRGLTMSDRLAAYVRTYWPLLLGHLAALIAGWAAARLGVTVDSTLVYELLALGLSAAVYAAGRWLEGRTGDGTARLARAAGRWLLALGLDTGQPVYGLPPAETQSETELDAAGNIRQIRSVTTWPARE